MASISIARSQDLFLLQKSRSIELISEKYTSLPSIKLSEYKKELSNEFTSQSTCFSALFDTENICHEDTPLLLSDFIEYRQTEPHDENIIRSAFKTSSFNMQHFGLELNFEITIANKTTFWIFNRVNDNGQFDQYSSVIKLEVKQENNIYFSYGNFVPNDGKQDLIFRCFAKEQITLPLKDRSSQLLSVDTKEEEKKFDMTIHILDTCNERIQTTIECEKQKYEFEANWFLAVNCSRQTVYGATGAFCKLNQILIKNYEVNNSKLVKKQGT